MHSCTCLMTVSNFPIGAFGKLKESKRMTPSSGVPLRQKKLQQVAVQCNTAKSKSQERSEIYKDYFPISTMNDLYDDRFEVEKLKQQVKYMLQNTSSHAKQLELIDDLQRLGVAYHFKTEIKSIMDEFYKSGDYKLAETDLHTTALTFRLFRQNGYFVTQDIFDSFIGSDTKGFKLSLREDIKGMLGLYEASYLSIEGETIMEHALNFTTTHFCNLEINEKLTEDTFVYALLIHALELPLHWRTQRLEAGWFIDTYPRKHDMSACLLQFAKLDFNMVQSMYRDELRALTSWWENLGLAKAMNYVRDSLVISHTWSSSIYWEPEYTSVRKVLTKATALLTTFDDVYDVNGALNELEQFTSAIERWDVKAIEELPCHMNMCYVALYNLIDELAYVSLNKNGFDSSPTLKNAWTTLLRSYLNESRWCHLGSRPSLQEYMSNARISVGVYSMTLHAYIFDPKPVSEEDVKYLESEPDIVKWSAVIFRACNDLATCQDEVKRGTDTPKSVQCYMHETQVSQEEAEKHVRNLVTKGWKELNKIRYTKRNISLRTIDKLVDTARASLSIYQYTNRNGMEDSVTKHLISKILYDPISL